MNDNPKHDDHQHPDDEVVDELEPTNSPIPEPLDPPLMELPEGDPVDMVVPDQPGQDIELPEQEIGAVDLPDEQVVDDIALPDVGTPEPVSLPSAPPVPDPRVARLQRDLRELSMQVQDLLDGAGPGIPDWQQPPPAVDFTIAPGDGLEGVQLPYGAGLLAETDQGGLDGGQAPGSLDDPGTSENPKAMYATYEGSETAQTDTWDIDNQGENDGVIEAYHTRTVYKEGTDEILYGFYRTRTSDSNGKLLSVSAETRYTIDAPEDCDEDIDGGTY